MKRNVFFVVISFLLVAAFISSFGAKAQTIHGTFLLLAAQLESYRAMKPGNTAPDFAFRGDVFAPGYGPSDIPVKLSDLDSEYTLVVFGAGWCPGCPEELSQIAGLHGKWQAHDIEVVFVSLDEERQVF